MYNDVRIYEIRIRKIEVMLWENANIIIVPIIILLVILLLNIFLVYKSSENKTLENVKLKEVEKLPNGLAIMLEKENEDGTYSYIESDTSSWPDDLVINYDKSGCIDTNVQIIEDSLTYNFETKIVTVETGVTTKCYLYFDIDKTFAIYSETDNSLRFYNNNDYKTIESKDTYNDLADQLAKQALGLEWYYWIIWNGMVKWYRLCKRMVKKEVIPWKVLY